MKRLVLIATLLVLGGCASTLQTAPAQHEYRFDRAAVAADHPVASEAGLEMLERPAQAALDDWVAGRIDETEMLRRTRWDERWGYRYGHYAPVLRFARAKRIPLVALSVPREIPRRVLANSLAAAQQCDMFLVIGTSGAVHPAASLVSVAQRSGACLLEFNIERSAISGLVDLFVPGSADETLPLLLP